MIDHRPAKPVSTAQIIGILASTLALFFLVAFGTKAFDAYRLRIWRDEIKAEISAMERERMELEAEKKRRQPDEYAEQVLRDAGMVPEGGVLVTVVERTPTPIGAEAGSQATPAATPLPGVAEVAAVEANPPADGGLFENANWNAWKQLIWGFD
ncbi:MAG: hypothetical protein ACYC4R_05325 [Anaerolineae bacterium]